MRSRNIYLNMKKVRIGPSIIILLVLCLIFQNIILLFNYLLALFLHEMAHLIVAMKRGYRLKMFKLDMLGMTIELDAEINNNDTFAINIAGPACNLFICLICTAMYWLVKDSYTYLNMFCMSNLCLAVFNLLPVYPLDGGKIFAGIAHKNEKLYKTLDNMIRISLFLVFILLFTFSISDGGNWLYLLFSFFFITSRPRKATTFSIFKNAKRKNFEKVNLVKINKDTNILALIKLVKPSNYTIFYCREFSKEYFDEDTVVDFALKYPLNTTLEQIKTDLASDAKIQQMVKIENVK